MNAHTILTNARDIMAERGKANGHLLAEDGRVCIRGALVLATGLPEEELRGKWLFELPTRTREAMVECERLMGFKDDSFGQYTGSAAEWNNNPEVTTEMVVDRFEQGIEASAPDRELVLA